MDSASSIQQLGMTLSACVACKGAYDIDRPPCLLKECGHTFCEGCLEKLDSKTESSCALVVACPTCHISTHLKAGDRFPRNTVLLAFLASTKATASADDAASERPVFGRLNGEARKQLETAVDRVERTVGFGLQALAHVDDTDKLLRGEDVGVREGSRQVPEHCYQRAARATITDHFNGLIDQLARRRDEMLAELDEIVKDKAAKLNEQRRELRGMLNECYSELHTANANASATTPTDSDQDQTSLALIEKQHGRLAELSTSKLFGMAVVSPTVLVSLPQLESPFGGFINEPPINQERMTFEEWEEQQRQAISSCSGEYYADAGCDGAVADDKATRAAQLGDVPRLLRLAASSSQPLSSLHPMFGFQAVNAAAKHGYAGFIDTLVQLGCKGYDTCGKKTAHPMYVAAANGHANVIELLVRLEHGD